MTNAYNQKRMDEIEAEMRKSEAESLYAKDEGMRSEYVALLYYEARTFKNLRVDINRAAQLDRTGYFLAGLDKYIGALQASEEAKYRAANPFPFRQIRQVRDWLWRLWVRWSRRH